MIKGVRWSVFAVTALAVANGFSSSASAVQPLGFAAPVDVIAAPPSPYVATAALQNGAVGVAWTNGTQVFLKVRQPGQLNFPTTPLTYTPPGAFAAVIAGSPVDRPITLLPLTATTFLMGWGECGAVSCRAVSLNVASSAGAFPGVSVVSGANNVLSGYPPHFGVQSDGSAAAVWQIVGPVGYDVMVNRRIGSGGVWQPLSASSKAGTTAFPGCFAVAIDTAHSVSASWLSPSGQYDVVVRTRVGSSWGVKVTAGSVHSSAFVGTDPLHSLVSNGRGTVIAALDDLAGKSNYAPDVTATGVNILTLSPGSGTWVLAAQGVTGPGREARMPTVSMLADGSAVVRYTDFSSGITLPPSLLATTLLTQRRGASGSWSSPSVLDSFASNDVSGNVELARWTPTLLADGTYVTPVATPTAAAPLVAEGAGLVVRSGWTGAASLVTNAKSLASVYGFGGAIDATGRATLIFYDPVTSRYKARASALVKPAPYIGPRLSSVPRKNIVVTCSVGWAGASTATTYRWLRNGVVISGASAATYKPKAADVGKRLTCRVSAGNSAGTRTVTSPSRVVGS